MVTYHETPFYARLQSVSRPVLDGKSFKINPGSRYGILTRMKEVLLVQFRTDPEGIASEQAHYRKTVPDTVMIRPVSIFDFMNSETGAAALRAAAHAHDATIFGGSAEFDLDGGRAHDDPARTTSYTILDVIRPLITDILEHDMPFLGVCYGHQLFAEHCGGTVTNDKAQKKVGTHTVMRTEAGRIDPIFRELPDVFYAQYAHKDSITNHPASATVLGSSPNCSFAALRYGNNIYTTQFHPELTADDLRRRLQCVAGYLPETTNLEEMLHESGEASDIIHLFCKEVMRAI